MTDSSPPGAGSAPGLESLTAVVRDVILAHSVAPWSPGEIRDFAKDLFSAGARVPARPSGEPSPEAIEAALYHRLGRADWDGRLASPDCVEHVRLMRAAASRELAAAYAVDFPAQGGGAVAELLTPQPVDTSLVVAGALSGQRTEGEPLREAVLVADKRLSYCVAEVLKCRRAGPPGGNLVFWEARQEEAWIIRGQLIALRSSQGGAASTPEGEP